MSWTKKRYGTPVMYQSPSGWKERQRVTVENGNSCEFVEVVEVRCTDILAKQLDPKIVTLKALLEQGITIDPGQCASMLNITDVAQLEQYNTEDMKEVYDYLQKHGQEIIKPKEE